MPSYTARLSHHSISRAPAHRLKAQTLQGAKLEARRLLGDGFQGHMIRLCEMVHGQPLEVACATIGEPGWHNVQ